MFNKLSITCHTKYLKYQCYFRIIIYRLLWNLGQMWVNEFFSCMIRNPTIHPIILWFILDAIDSNFYYVHTVWDTYQNGTKHCKSNAAMALPHVSWIDKIIYHVILSKHKLSITACKKSTMVIHMEIITLAKTHPSSKSY